MIAIYLTKKVYMIIFQENIKRVFVFGTKELTRLGPGRSENGPQNIPNIIPKIIPKDDPIRFLIRFQMKLQIAVILIEKLILAQQFSGDGAPEILGKNKIK